MHSVDIIFVGTLITIMILCIVGIYKCCKDERRITEAEYKYKSTVTKNLIQEFGKHIKWESHRIFHNEDMLWAFDFNNGEYTIAIAADDIGNIAVYNMKRDTIPNGSKLIGYVRIFKHRRHEYYIFDCPVTFHNSNNDDYSNSTDIMKLL